MDVFSPQPGEHGHTTVLQHRIDTGISPPILQHPRRIRQSRTEEVRRLIDDMLKKDIIQHSSSPWLSPIVLVKKKDGSARFCVDYRKLNAVTKKDAYPLPRVDDTLDTLAGSKFFSTRRIAKKRHSLLVKDFLSLRGCLSDSATRQLPSNV